MTANTDDKTGLHATDDPSTLERAWVWEDLSFYKDFNRNGPANAHLEVTITNDSQVTTTPYIDAANQGFGFGQVPAGGSMRIVQDLQFGQKHYFSLRVSSKAVGSNIRQKFSCSNLVLKVT